MKACLPLVLTLTLIVGSLQTHAVLQVDTTGNLSRSSDSLYTVNEDFTKARGPAFGVNSSDDYQILNIDEIATKADGKGELLFTWLRNSTHLTLTNRIEGALLYHINENINANNPGYNNNITIHSVDNPDIASVTGSKAIASRSRDRGLPSHAVVFNNKHKDGSNAPGPTSRLIEGNYYGSPNMGAALLNNRTNFILEGTSFIAGDSDEAAQAYYTEHTSDPNANRDLNALDTVGSDIHFTYINGISSHSGQGMIMNITNRTSNHSRENLLKNYDELPFYDMIIGGNNTANEFIQIDNGAATIGGGHGIAAMGYEHDYTGEPPALPALTMNIEGGDYLAGSSKGNLIIEGSTNVAGFAHGGSGLMKGMGGGLTIKTGQFAGGHAGRVEVSASHSLADAVGGYGIWSEKSNNSVIENVSCRAGRGGDARVHGMEGLARADGGNGIFLGNSADQSTLRSCQATGNRAGTASAKGTGSDAFASGGHGLYAANSRLVTIEGGTYSGADGGTAHGDDFAAADGGSGIRVDNGSLVVKAGTFSGGSAGLATGSNISTRQGRGLYLYNSGLTINESAGTTLINDGIYVQNDSRNAQGILLNSGIIRGDIDLEMAPDSIININGTAGKISHHGSLNQYGGILEMNLGTKGNNLLKQVNIHNGTMRFINNEFTASPGLELTLNGQESTLVFRKGAHLGSGSRILANEGRIVSESNLTFGADSTILFGHYESSLSRIVATNTLYMTNANIRLGLVGTVSAPTGTITLASASTTELGNNTAEELVDADLGWLVEATGVQIDSDIAARLNYRSISNGNLQDLPDSLQQQIDSALTNNANAGLFVRINSMTQSDAEELIRYAETQLPDVADIAFQVQHQVAEQIAARGSEVRTFNGFSTTKRALNGAAGPGEEREIGMQGWIRAYGTFTERDGDGTFVAYDSDLFGTVVGIDKSFGNLLIGLAGGHSSGTIDAGSAYNAEVSTVHGTLYSTLSDDSSFIDLAMTVGRSNTEIDNEVSDNSFEAYTLSGYIGIGQLIEITEQISITPEASFLAAYYAQESFANDGLLAKNVNEYDEWSWLGGLGARIAAAQKLDFVPRVAITPELRIHWLHEFNADLEDFTYSSVTDSFAVRSREEDLLKIGLGLDLWNWKREDVKFEVDYDGLFGSSFDQHTLSGKVTLKF